MGQGKLAVMLKMPFTGGLPETGCGIGSMLASTAGIREALPKLLKEIEVRTLLDAPCGDFNWMARTDLSGVNYIGCDYDGEHCLSASMRVSQPIEYRPKTKVVLTLDVCRDNLTFADLMLCRDFLQHLPNDLASMVLGNFASSNIPWLLTTSHDNSENVDITSAGMFRRLNLTVGPFSLPAPRKSIPDGDGRILGLWHRSDWT